MMQQKHNVYGRRLAVAGLSCLCLAVSACGSIVTSGASVEQIRADDLLRAKQAYIIHPGDELEIVHVVDTDYNATVTVGPDGNISVPGLPESIPAAGLDTRQLTENLGELYQRHSVQQPHFSVILRRLGSQQVFIGGEVLHPGYLEFPGGERHIMQVLMAAGGLLPTARASEVIVVRDSASGKRMVFSINVNKIVSGEDLSQDIVLHSLDTVYVPRSHITQADIWVDQHIRQLLPFSTSASYSYNMGTYKNNP